MEPAAAGADCLNGVPAACTGGAHRRHDPLCRPGHRLGIILQRPVEILPGDTEARLHARAVAAGAELLPEAVRLIAAGTAPCIPQDESQATYYSFPPKGTFTLL